MEIGAAYGRAGDFEDDIAVFEGSGFGDFGCCRVRWLAREQKGGRGKYAMRSMGLTDFDGVLAHPDQGLHLLAGRVCVLLTVATGVGHVLFGHSIVAMTECFLNQVCCLCYRCHADDDWLVS